MAPRKSTINKMIDLITDEPNMNRWSNWSTNGYKYELRRNIRTILNKISGDDIVHMIRGTENIFVYKNKLKT
jgi:hypothetical protein